MLVQPDLPLLAKLLADSGRAAMLMTLLDGQSYPATDLARVMRVSPQTASFHLRRLLDAGVVVMEAWGRHRYYRLASDRIASMLELFALAAPEKAPRNVVENEQTRAIRLARTCYDHLAGRLGVAVTDAMEARRLVAPSTDRDYEVTRSGVEFFLRLGIDVNALPRRRALARRCLDWSERRPHLAGALAAAFTARCFELGWLVRLRRTRAVALTPSGKKALACELEISVDSLSLCIGRETTKAPARSR